MANTMVDFVNNNLTQLLMDDKDLITEIEDEVESLTRELNCVQLFLKDATRSHSRSRSEILKHFANVLSTVVNQAENLIDQFVIEAKLHQKKGIKKFFDLRYVVKARDCAARIRSITKNLTKLQINGNYSLSMCLQFEEDSQQGSSHELKRAPVTEEDEVVGFDKEADKIINRLLGGSDDLQVIPIVGMAGIGKTTLANKVYKGDTVESEFCKRIWVYVSQSYTRRDLLLNMIHQLNGNIKQYRYVTEEALVEEVHKHLLLGRYLVVLDDLWTLEAWEDVKIAFPNSLKRSRIMITTRDSMVANMCCDDCPHHLKFLTDDECWELLQKKVFHRGKCPQDLEEVGKRIAMKCMGLPLATLVIAGALIGRGKTKSEWEKVHQGVSERSTSGDFLKTMKLVQTSYDSLPFNLKVCFLYCGVFPRGSEIPARKIVWLWIAEGFVEAPKKSTLETLAEEYLNELVSKNLLMVTRRTSNGQIKTCRMHDMLHEFCTLEASQENLFKEIKQGIEQSFPKNQELATYRRLCFDSSVKEFISTKPYGEVIRSFLCFSSQEFRMSPYEFETIAKSFPLLRVFDIESILISRFHKHFFQLYHLRYIALSSDSLEVLPKFMGDLWNLQTLIILTQQMILDIQADICNMPRLRHLYTNASAKLQSSAAVKSDEHGGLQTLSTIEPESCTHVSERCQNLKMLGIRGEIKELDGLLKNITALTRLENMKLLNFHPSSFGKLHLPPENIFPKSLKKVTLLGTMLAWGDMIKLELLPALEVLKLKKHAFIGDEWVSMAGCFPCLKVLWIEQIGLVTWKASSIVFRSLERLFLHRLDKLKEVPIELADIRNLQKMELVNTTTTAVESARDIQAERECFGYTGFELFVTNCN